MPALFTTFASSQVIGLSAAGFFLGSTMGISPFNVVPILESSNIPRTARAPLYGHMFHGRGRPAFALTALGGAAAFITAYYSRPANISVEQSRALLVAAGSLLIAVPHTIIWMVPIYSALGDVKYSGTEVESKVRWDKLMRSFHTGNSIRVLLYAAAYGLGIYSLASSQVTSVF
ncbi:hypothetical protein DFH09DRAFT_1366789 [Mycena vulgaris]|nr:hypothetical protein DFH09DRAFT_1366789 [Mycena vulgaris]